MSEWLDVDKIIELSHHYRAFGPLIGLLFPFIESFYLFCHYLFLYLQMRVLMVMVRFFLSWVGRLGRIICGVFVNSKIWTSSYFSFLTKGVRVQKLN